MAGGRHPRKPPARPTGEASTLRWHRLILLALIALGVLASVPDLVHRVAAEQGDRYVELVADETTFQQLAAATGETPQQVLAAVHRVGVEGLGVYEDTLESLDGLGLVTMVSGSQWIDGLRLAGAPLPAAVQPGATYGITADVPLATFVQSGLAAASGLPVSRLDLPGGSVAVGVNLPVSVAGTLPLGFRPPSPGDGGAFALARALGMDVVPRPETGLVPMTAAQVDRLFGEIASGGVPVHEVLFGGPSTQPIPGYPSALDATAAELRQHGWNLAVIETPQQRGNVDQPGTRRLNALVDQHTVRVYSVPPWMLQDYSEQDTVQAIVTSVRERNLRIVYLHPYQTGTNLVARTVQLYGDVAARLRAQGYVLAPPHPFPAVRVHRSQRVVQTVAVVAAGLLLLELWWPGLRRWGYAPLAVLGACGALVAAVSEHVTQLLVPMVCAPVFGGLSVWYLAHLWTHDHPGASPQPESAAASRAAAGPAPAAADPPPAAADPPAGATAAAASAAPGFWAVWLRAVATAVTVAGITFAGALIVASLLGDTTHFLEWEYFRGIKVTYLGIPALALVAYAVQVGFGARPGEARPGFLGQVTWLGRQSVRYGHVLVAVLAGVVGYVYLLRSGNVNHVPAIEEAMRHFLARTLPARPREKEFLVGYPSLFLAMLALSRRSRWWFLAFLVGAAVSQVSLVDTFEHIRTPFLRSVQREALGLLLGLLTGTAALAVGWAAMRVHGRWRSLGWGDGRTRGEAGERTWPAS
jgi:hypothetical protein